MQKLRQSQSTVLAAVTAAEWMIFVLLSTSTCAFIPKYHWLPFFSLVHLRIALPLAVLENAPG